jgi:hypothetical protein
MKMEKIMQRKTSKTSKPKTSNISNKTDESLSVRKKS